MRKGHGGKLELQRNHLEQDMPTQLQQERLDRVRTRAVEVLGSKATVWLAEPNSALNDEVPQEMILTEEGTGAVEDLLGRIEHGLYS
jgi:putative toxin-antitoxin system antitoxin component (TIGR02293 family)